MATDACNGALNTGQPTCVPRKNVDAGIILVPQVANDGTVNKILSSDVVDASYVTALINQTDKSKRWTPLMDLKTVIGERAENTTQDIDGVAFNVKQGIRAYDGSIFGNAGNPQLEGAIKSRANLRDAYFKVDINGNLTGNLDADGNLLPIKIEFGTLQALYKEPTSSEVQNVNIKFSIKESEKDSDMRTLGSATITADLLSISGVIDIQGVVTLPAITGFTLNAELIYGDPFNLPAFSGALVADWVLTDTVLGAIVPASAIEGVDGEYVFLATLTSSNTIILTSSKDGFELAPITFVIP